MDLIGTFGNFCREEYFFQSLNAIFSSLFPKNESAIELEDFRPISLLEVCER